MKNILIVGANGYVGSLLYKTLKLHQCKIFGIDSFVSGFNTQFIDDDIKRISYQNISPKFLDQFTDCIWLAGHSSVKMSSEDKQGALRNNLYDLINFSNLFRGRLIYASSGSVYSRNNAEKADENFATLIPSNIYDYTKIAFDNYIGATKSKAIALRFGTVNGYSPRIRNELMINSMVASSINNGYLKISNKTNFRSILFIDDLINGIMKILDSDVDNGIFNMCSFNASIEEIGETVAQAMNVKIKYGLDNPTYNFMMDTSKFEREFNFKFTNDIGKIIEQLCNNSDINKKF
jgi:nucleoside-diphosphate-sugar epimerase